MFTGGKDSTYACELVMRQGFEVSCLITLRSQNKESYMLHTAAIEITELSAKAMELPLVTGYTEGKKEEELSEIKNLILSSRKQYGFDALVSGGIASVYQKERIQRIAEECEVSSINPLWGIDQQSYLNTLLEDRYIFIITSVSAEGLDQSWLGREITQELIMELKKLSSKFGFNPAFEGGEAETLVLDCPLFRKYRLAIMNSEIVWNGYYGRLEIKDAKLELKNGER